MSKVTQKEIVAGQVVYMAGYSYNTRKVVPLKLIISSGMVEKESQKVAVVYAYVDESKTIYGPSNCVDGTSAKYIFLGDLGIEGYKYDDRCTQLFTTEQEMQEAINSWYGRNPNFVDEEGNDIERDSTDCLGYE